MNLDQREQDAYNLLADDELKAEMKSTAMWQMIPKIGAAVIAGILFAAFFL
jgi:glutaredoxin-related protein